MLSRLYMQGGKYNKNTTALGKVVIITGANTGIGKETARELSKRGATIYMACRDMVKCEKARQELIKDTCNKNIHSMKLDLASLKSIKEFADNFKKKESRLDILINNAGIMACPRMATEDGFEMQIGVNHLGHFYLTNLLLDLLKKSAPSRIVMLSSLSHRFGPFKKHDFLSENSYSPSKVYSHSKISNILFAHELAKRLQGSKVTVNSLHPGVVDTELVRYYKIFNIPILSPIVSALKWIFFKTTPNGAQTTIYAALDPDLELVSGAYFSDCRPTKTAAVARNDELAKWLWVESDRLINLKLVQLNLK
ncbi:retinol dehydrogenase 12 isoform X2 [Ceratitis capitata]|uniref:retinol dehydrogenase 12 isoform X2 n=1 Tax=Ceratitis capitata TaxID=7213 RepID=UPI0006189047|nr:retinol dehydrogenase 12 isoform X2 [Ceratitis capitata]XP_020716597.1 retinol dehydrogenase 12 isoform X2 [Ceratitis capitata]